MSWPVQVLIALGPLVVVASVVLLLRLIGVRGHAPGWQLRCTRCDRTHDAAEAGLVRIGAASVGKFTLGWCSGCRRLRRVAIERKTHST
ncbi:MAG: hypothetical protein WD009_03120 [Phycisphaeraceae bacterium]